MSHRLLATLLLTLPSMVAMVPALAHSGRTIDVTVSRSAMVPGQIALHPGERVRLHFISADGRYTCRAGGVGFDAQIPAGGAATTVDVTPAQPGIFPIHCSADGAVARERGRFVVQSER